MLAATPIGSHTHASPALREALSAADVIAAEDTRRLAALLRRIDVATAARVLSYFEGNEAARTAELTGAVADGQDVVLVTDAACRRSATPGTASWRPVSNATCRSPRFPGRRRC